MRPLSIHERPQTHHNMFLNFGIIINAILMVLGLLWCHAMFGRWRRDLNEFQTTQDPDVRHALAILWGVTAVIAILLINFFVGILKNLGVL